MNNKQNFADRILKLEALAEYGDPKSLASVYSAMHKEGLISTGELEVMIGSNKNRESELEHSNTASAAILSFGDALAKQVQEGKAPDSASINYLRWNIADSSVGPGNEKLLRLDGPIRSEAIQAVFKIMKSEVSSGIAPDWGFMQSLIDYSDNMVRYWYPKKSLKEYDPKSNSSIQEGILSICYACKQRNMRVPGSFEYFLGNEYSQEEDRIESQSIPQDAGLPSLEEKLDRGTGEEKQEAFGLLTQAYCSKIEQGNLSRTEWEESVFQTQVLPYALTYNVDEETLRQWYGQTEPKIAAANALFAGSLDAENLNMTSGFKEFLFSAEGLRNPFLSKAFNDFNKLKIYDEAKATLALSREVLHPHNRSVTIIGGTDLPRRKTLVSSIAHAVSEMPNANGLMRSTPILHIDKANNVTTIDGFLKKGNDFYHVFDPNGKIPVDYINVYDLKKPWYPRLYDTPRVALADCLEAKGIYDSFLQGEGVKVPNNITFWTKKNLPPILQNIREGLSNAYQVGDMSRADIAAEVQKFVAPQNGRQGIKELVIKPVDGSMGRDVMMLREEGDGSLPERVAGRVFSFAENGESCILQERIISPEWVNSEGKKTDCALRVWVCPDGKGRPVACGSYARVGETGGPINLETGAKAMNTDEWIEGLRAQHPDLGLEIDTLKKRILEVSEEAYTAVKGLVSKGNMPGEDTLSIMGMDLMVNLKNGELIPTVIEINDTASGTLGIGGDGANHKRAQELLRQAWNWRNSQQRHRQSSQSTSLPTILSR